MSRSTISAERLARARSAQPEQRAQALDSWLEVATPGEVRRHWRRWMGSAPAWALRGARLTGRLLSRMQ